MSTPYGPIGDTLARVATAVVRYPVVVIALVAIVVVFGGRFAAGNLGINTDTANMISPTLEWRQDFIAYREAFPSRDRNIVIAVDAGDPDVAAAAATDLAAALERQPHLFERVFLAGHGAFFERNGLLYLPLETLESLSDSLIEAQPVIGRLATRYSGAAVLDLAREAVSAERAAGFDATAVEPLLAAIAATVRASAAGESRPLGWDSLIADPAMAGSPARQLLLVRPVLDFDRVQPAAAAIAAIRAEAETLGATYGASLEVRLSGTVAMEHEELVSVTRGASAAGIAALVTVMLVLLWALRSVVLLLLSLVTLLAGLVLTAAFAAATVGHLNLISVAFAVLYVGLGVDFILHMCLRLKELLAAGHERRIAVVETARGVGSSLVICAVTTAAGFFAFIPTDFDGVSELGLISGGGMFISLAISLTLLPALLAVAWHPAADRLTRRSSRLAAPLLPRVATPHVARIVVWSAVPLFLIALLTLPGLQFDSNPIHLRDPDSESIRLLDELASASEAPLFSMAAIARDRTDASSWAEALAGNPLVERVITASALVPGDQEEKVLLLEDLRFVLGDDFAQVREMPLDAAALATAVDALQAALGGIDRPSPAAGELRAALAEWLAAHSAAAPERAGSMLQQLDRDLRSDLPEQLAALDTRLSAQPFGLTDLPVPLRERWVDAEGRELVEFVPAEDLNDNEAAARFVAAIRAVAPRATGLPVVYQEASRTIVAAFAEALCYALIMVTVLLLLLLRRVRDTVLVIAPILFAAVMTAAVAVWLDLPFNFANIIALPLLIGVGVDNGIHIVHRMRTEPPTSGGPFATSTSRAVLASGLTTIASFGNLAFSAHVGMASMGQLLTIGMLVTLVATLILLPALLSLRKPA